MKVSQVVIAPGAGFTNILATMPAHRVEIFDASASRLQLDYETPFDAFATVTSTAPTEGNRVTLLGHGVNGIIGRPPNYNAQGAPATGDIIAKVRTTGAAGCTVTVLEYEDSVAQGVR